MTSSHKFLSEPKTAAIIGCPFGGGQPKLGVDQGPVHLVNAGLPAQLSALGWSVIFDGHLEFAPIDVETDPPIGILNNPRAVSTASQKVADIVSSHAKKGQLTVSLGGDHSLSMGTISGTLYQYPDACIIWVDAHADINTVETTMTGNMHGMPLSFLLGLNDPVLPEFAWVSPSPPRLTPDRIVYIGLRDVDPGEKVLIEALGIKAFSMHEVDALGIGRVVALALDHVNPARDRPVHLSFDIDTLDPSVAPSTGTSVPGGLTYREARYICEAVHKTGCIVAFDMVEVNPLLGSAAEAETTVAVANS